MAGTIVAESAVEFVESHPGMSQRSGDIEGFRNNLSGASPTPPLALT
jgi:hypothetical protein